MELTTFIRTFLNVYKIDVYNKNTGTWGVYKDPSKCEGRIENVKNFFSNNFKEVEDFDLLSIYPWISVISESFNLGTRSLTQDATKEMTLSQFENIIGSAVRNIVNKNMNIEEAMRFIEIMYSSN